jgi:GntR family transcriptional regulator
LRHYDQVRDEGEGRMTSSYDNTSMGYISPPGGDAWARDAARTGRVGTQRILGVAQIEASEDIRRALDLHPGEQVVVRRRLILADGQPVELADSIYPASIAAGTDLALDKKIKGGAIAVLAQLGQQIADAVERITARRPEPIEAHELGIPADEPLLVLTRIGRNAAGVPIELAVNRMVASRVEPLAYKPRTDA